MRYFFAVCLLVLPLAGCVTSSHDVALQTWHSPSSTLEQRARAVSELVPTGASRQSAESVLGTFGLWSHMKVRNMAAGNDDEIYSLNYPFSDGKVTLFFDTSIGYNPIGFVRAVPYHQKVGIINTP